jgi:hypothetical protein
MSTNFQQRKAFLADLEYILEQARAFRDYVRSGTKKELERHPFEQIIHNALLESSLSFLRKINEFFGGHREASVCLFLPDYPRQWLWDQADSDLLNERVMHLSLCEAREGKLDWAAFYSAHLPEAERRFDEFLLTLNDKHPDYFQQG